MPSWSSVRRDRQIRRTLSGAAAGAAAACAMSQFGRAWVRGSPALPRSADDRDTETLAQTVAAHLLGRALTRAELRRAVPLLRYGLGAAAGVVYAVAVEPRVSPLAAGATVGVALWACAELLRTPDGAAPQGRWTDSSARESLASHLVYGVTLQFLERQLSRPVDEEQR